jgi:hypothetical protein
MGIGFFARKPVDELDGRFPNIFHHPATELATSSRIDALSTAASVTESDRGRSPLVIDLENLACSCFLKIAALFAKFRHYEVATSPIETGANAVTARLLREPT